MTDRIDPYQYLLDHADDVQGFLNRELAEEQKRNPVPFWDARAARWASAAAIVAVAGLVLWSSQQPSTDAGTSGAPAAALLSEIRPTENDEEENWLFFHGAHPRIEQFRTMNDLNHAKEFTPAQVEEAMAHLDSWPMVAIMQHVDADSPLVTSLIQVIWKADAERYRPFVIWARDHHVNPRVKRIAGKMIKRMNKRRVEQQLGGAVQ